MEKSLKRVDLSSCCYGGIKDRIFDFAVLPWGATEPHNYHLPYSTDVLLSHVLSLESVALAGEKGARGMVLPPVWLGSQNPGQWNRVFCVHGRYETQFAILRDVVASLYRQGLRLLFILNGHGGNCFKNMVRDLAFDFPDFTIIVVNWFSILPQDAYFEERDDHAGEMETSVMMHYFPDLVSFGLAGNGASRKFASASLNDGVGWLPRNWSRISSDTGVGNPLKSSAEKGKRYAHDLVLRLSNLFVEVVKSGVYSED